MYYRVNSAWLGDPNHFNNATVLIHLIRFLFSNVVLRFWISFGSYLINVVLRGWSRFFYGHRILVYSWKVVICKSLVIFYRFLGSTGDVFRRACFGYLELAKYFAFSFLFNLGIQVSLDDSDFLWFYRPLVLSTDL